MHLHHGLHLAYCTNIHRGQSWAETFASLDTHTLAVRRSVCPRRPYAIGLRLSAQAAHELSAPPALKHFRQWLDRHDCYVFTINGFPYGQFHGTRVKEQVYAPDWTQPERLEYTRTLFDLLAQMLPEGMEGSVSTVPGSFKAFIHQPEQERAMRDQLWQCVDHIEKVSRQSGRLLHLGLEPEPLCYLETSAETARFFDQLREDRPHDPRLATYLGVNYDTCHLAIQYEDPSESIQLLEAHQVRISKIHLSSALKLRPSEAALQALSRFVDPVYFHQVIARDAAGHLTRYRDLDEALEARDGTLQPAAPGEEWRVHFHIPLHAPPSHGFATTTDHLLAMLDLLGRRPSLCRHLEMETYTWEVLPPEWKSRGVEEQLIAEYDWTLRHLSSRGLGPGPGDAAP